MAARSRAQEKAQALRQQLRLGHGYVDVFDALRQLEIEVYRHPFPGDGLEGAFTVRSGVPFVFVNSQGALTRQRLTAAHELGHHELGPRLDGTEVLEGPASANGDHGEWEAFRFARHLLMDEQGVRQLCADIRDEEERVAAVASEFVVSPAVAAIHLAELRLIKPSTKERLKEGFDTGGFTPGAFLRRYGYRMKELSDPTVELDPGHQRRAVSAFVDGALSLTALAEALQLSEEEARQMLRESGLELDEDEVPGELVTSA
jgi:Zn-dependent peptidase ImmA (M78 family)